MGNFLTKILLAKNFYKFEKIYILNSFRNIIGGVLLGSSIILFVFNLMLDLHIGFYILAILLFCFGILSILTGEEGLIANHKLVFQDKDPQALGNLKTSGLYGDYNLVLFNDQYYLHSFNVNNIFTENDIPISISGIFDLNQDLRKAAPFVLKQFQTPSNRKMFTKHLGLFSDLTMGRLMAGERVYLKETDYFSGLCSNEIALKEIWDKNQENKFLDGMTLISDRYLLKNLNDSLCANIIGINTVFITKDNEFFITRQNKHYANNYNQLIPSISSSLELSDYKNQRTLKELLIDALDIRIKRYYNLKEKECFHIPLGYTRLLNRGGKPEFFFVTIVDKKYEEITSSHIINPEKEFNRNILNVIGSTENFESFLKYILESRTEEFSVQLFYNLFCLYEGLSKKTLQKYF